MMKTLKNVALAGSLIAAMAVATAPAAEARRGARAAGAVAGAIIGLGVLGAYAASRDHERRHYRRSCYEGRQRCEVVGERCWYNRYGEYRCKEDVRCHRPTICD